MKKVDKKIILLICLIITVAAASNFKQSYAKYDADEISRLKSTAEFIKSKLEINNVKVGSLIVVDDVSELDKETFKEDEKKTDDKNNSAKNSAESQKKDDSSSNNSEIVNKPSEIKSKTLVATFNMNGSESIGSNSLSCTTNNTSCTIKMPSIKRDGYKIIGWSKSSSENGISYAVGSTQSISEDTTFYAITKKEDSYYINDAHIMLSLVNDARVNVGAQPLVWSESLSSSAKIRAVESYTLFSHTRPNGTPWSTVNPLAYGENLAAGNITVAETFEQWMNSDGHRANILKEGFKTIGIAGYCVPSSPYRCYWVQLFGY